MEEIKKILRDWIPVFDYPHTENIEGAAKEITLLLLEEKVKAFEEARIIVFRAANEMVAEANLYKEISGINKEIDSLKKL